MKEPAPYAKGTKVDVEKSRLDLEALLAKHGARNRAVVHNDEQALTSIIFEISGRRYRLDVPTPNLESFRPPKVAAPISQGWERWSASRREQWIQQQYEQCCRERWRFLVLAMKAKLELVRIGLSTIEREFLADLLLPDGQTASEALGQYMEKLLANGYSGPLALPAAPEQ